MNRWTNEQIQAINQDNTNIIVSAGAGSGKTAVLTQRVIRKLKSGVSINELLILTFTNAASAEMKHRIRQAISKDPSLQDQLNYIDSAYITTFDSYALSIVRKYHYLINAKKDISIVDDNVIKMETQMTLDALFDDLYKQEDPDFLKLISDFCVKDDSNIKKAIIALDEKTNLITNKAVFLDMYLDNYYSEEAVNKNIRKYMNLIKDKLEQVKFYLSELLSLSEGKFYDNLHNLYLTIASDFNGYDDVKNAFTSFKIPNLPKNSESEVKSAKDNLKIALEGLNSFLTVEDEATIREQIVKTYSYAKIIINLISKLDERQDALKRSKDMYSFIDIAKMAFNILNNHVHIRNEIKNSFKEIMVDEYQDTSDIQEDFINLIANNNVYMVGDIKQSIYRFRNANPYLFQDKYNRYSKNDSGIKIDLTNNFRSRKEVVQEINTIFQDIMTIENGGADYLKEHQMKSGNLTYEENKPNQNYELEIYDYRKFDDKILKDNEYEAFVIANDIKEKVLNKYQVFDKDLKGLRSANYSDFVILMDRSKDFDLYKKIFTYLNIPLQILKDDKITNEYDIYIIRNILKILVKIRTKVYDQEFRYLYTSIARSYLCRQSDNEIYETFVNNHFYKSSLYETCLKISNHLDYLTINEVLHMITTEFKILEKIPQVGDSKKRLIILEYLNNLGDDLSSIGYSIYDYINHLDDVLKLGLDVSYSSKVSEAGDTVKIMSIHKSKGLEFSICYFSGLKATFNEQDLKADFCFDKEFGIIMPYYNEYKSDTIYKTLFIDRSRQEELSERIRLLYVALTRSKEKIILLYRGNEEHISTPYDIYRKHSFLDLLDGYINKHQDKTIILEANNLYDSQYKFNRTNVVINSQDEPFQVQEVNYVKEVEEKTSFSKKINRIIDLHEYKNLEIGTKVHQALERLDFLNPNFNILDLDSLFVNKIKTFLNSKLLENLNKGKVYKEYSFYDLEDNKEGVIDLMIEYPDYIDIIDYKLNNLDDEGYSKQLNGYLSYIKKKTNKKVNIYLYSLLEEKYIKL